MRSPSGIPWRYWRPGSPGVEVLCQTASDHSVAFSSRGGWTVSNPVLGFCRLQDSSGGTASLLCCASDETDRFCHRRVVDPPVQSVGHSTQRARYLRCYSSCLSSTCGWMRPRLSVRARHREPSLSWCSPQSSSGRLYLFYCWFTQSRGWILWLAWCALGCGSPGSRSSIAATLPLPCSVI